MYTVDSIVREAIIEGGGNTNLYARYYQYAVSGLRELHLDVSGVPLTIECFPNTAGEIDMPDDFANYISISVLGANGTLIGLGRNHQLNMKNYFSACGVPVRNTGVNSNSNVTNGDFYYSNVWNLGHIRNGEALGRYFNAGGYNTVGAYRLDWENKKILIDNFQGRGNCRSVIVEYVSDLSAVNSDYELHPFLIETIKAWIYWKSIQRDRNYTISEKEQAKNDFNFQRKHCIGRYSAGTLQEWKDAISRGFKASTKWQVP